MKHCSCVWAHCSVNEPVWTERHQLDTQYDPRLLQFTKELIVESVAARNTSPVAGKQAQINPHPQLCSTVKTSVVSNHGGVHYGQTPPLSNAKEHLFSLRCSFASCSAKIQPKQTTLWSCFSIMNFNLLPVEPAYVLPLVLNSLACCPQRLRQAGVLKTFSYFLTKE